MPYLIVQPIHVAARYKALVYGRSVAGIVVSNPAGVWMFASRECCVLSASGSSLVQRSLNACGVSNKCDR